MLCAVLSLNVAGGILLSPHPQLSGSTAPCSALHEWDLNSMTLSSQTLHLHGPSLPLPRYILKCWHNAPSASLTCSICCLPVLCSLAPDPTSGLGSGGQHWLASSSLLFIGKTWGTRNSAIQKHRWHSIFSCLEMLILWLK